MLDEKLTRNFRLSEFLNSDAAVRLELDNTPTEEHLHNIRTHLAPGMQRIRDLLNFDHGAREQVVVLVSSGYRSPTVNAAVGGSKTSQHMQGLAADFTAPAFGTPREICQLLVGYQDVIRFDQLILEGGKWVHVSFSAAPRASVLTAHFEGGRVRYTQGIA